MPNATVRAEARVLPKSTDPAPSDEYEKLWAAKCVADARYEVAAEKRKAEAAAKAEEPKLKASEAFVIAHFDWLRAVAAIEDPEASDEEMTERFAAEIEAERRLFTRLQPTRSRSGRSWRRLRVCCMSELVDSPPETIASCCSRSAR